MLSDIKDKQVFLFFDLEVSGHHIEYLSHLIRYRIQNTSAGKFILLINPLAVERLVDFNLPANWSRAVVIEHPNDNERQMLDKAKSKIQKAKEELKILKRIGNKYQVSTSCLMSLNKYQLALGGQLGRSLPGNIRGILFNPLGRSGKLLNDFLLGPRKKAQISWMLRNEKINRIFLLNDKEKAVELNKYYKKREAFKSLPDPVQPLSSAQSDPVSITEDDQGRIKFLLFGSLSESKGIFIVLDALKVLPSFVSSQIEIIFAGNLSNNIRNKFLDHLSQFRKRDSKLKVTLLDKFLSNLEAANLFSSVDFVLAPYIGSEASSGIIGYAAAYKKPVIGTNKGLLGSLIINYQLGFAIYPMNADNLSSIIQRVITYDFNTIETRGMEQFVKERHPDNFVFNLIN